MNAHQHVGLAQVQTNVNINGTIFPDPLTVYIVNHTLALKALLSSQDYFVSVQASSPYSFNNSTNVTSSAIRVGGHPPPPHPLHPS